MANQGSLPFCRSVSVWRSKKDTLSTRTTEKLDLVAYDGHAELRFRFGPSNKMVWFFIVVVAWVTKVSFRSQ